MATMANWNGHTFVVSPDLIRGYTDLSIRGSCETTTKNSDKQKYVERKYGEIPQISMTVSLNAQTGVTDVYAEAMEYVKDATDGACEYFYLGGEKLFQAKMMLTEAEIVEIAEMPGRGRAWISCDVKLKFQQGGKMDGNATGGGTSGSSGGSVKQSVRSSGVNSLSQGVANGAVSGAVSTALNAVSTLIGSAKASSSGKTQSGLAYQTSLVERARTKAQKIQSSSVKTNATTGRPCEISTTKITRVAKKQTVNSALR